MASEVALEKSRKLLKVKQTQLEMMRDRGINIAATPEAPIIEWDATIDANVLRFTQFYSDSPEAKQILGGVSEFRQNLSRMYSFPKTAQDAIERKVLVVYLAAGAGGGAKKQIGVDPVREVINVAFNIKNLQTIVFISEVTFTPKTREQLEGITQFEIQFILDHSLMYNVTKHVDVPHHEALSDKEAEEFLKKNKLQRRQLPLMKFVDHASLIAQKDRTRVTDPVVVYYNFRPDQIIRITRKNNVIETLAEDYVTYRVVSY